MSRPRRVGWPGAAHAALVAIQVLLVAVGVVLGSRMAPAVSPLTPTSPPPDSPAVALLAGAGLLLTALLVFGAWTLLRARRLTRGTPGRARWLALGAGAVLHVAVLVPLAALVRLALERAPLIGMGAFLDLDPLLLSLPEAAVLPFYLLLAASGITWAWLLVTVVSCWFLVPPRARRVAWLGIDVVLVAGAAGAVVWLPFKPPADAPDTLLQPAVAVSVTALAILRLLVRFVGPLLAAVEGLGFRTLVAARHLRATKSNFLATIGTLSVLAVAFSSCSLTTTLSVMGGFRQDLKQKILGNNAHIMVDREHGTFEGWAPVLDGVREAPGVAAASPFLAGEVMVTSASNMAGAVLRGVDPETVNQVVDLADNMVQPDPGPDALDYLIEPERLLDVPDELRRGPTTTPRVPSRQLDEADPDPPAPPGQGLLGDLPALEPGPDDQAPGPGYEPEPVDDASDEVLPGIIVGRELARSLRLYVGDEVTVVSPFGDLGPTGPMPKSRPFRVAGIFYSGMYEYDMKYAYTTLPVAQGFLNVGDAISGVEIKAMEVERAPAIAQGIRGAIGRDDLRVQDWQELNKGLFGALALEKLAMFITLGIAILVAGFCVFGTLTLMVQEKSREVGILKAMGTPSRAVVGVFLIEGLLIGVFGASMGLGLGYLVCFVAEHFGIRMNPEVYYIDRLPVHVDPLDFTLVGIAAAVICLLATIFPAMYASRLQPVDALRYD